jgi:hypothetical protein
MRDQLKVGFYAGVLETGLFLWALFSSSFARALVFGGSFLLFTKLGKT